MVWSTQTGEVLIDIVTRPGQTDHGHGGGALAYGGKPAAGGVVAPPQPRPPPAAPYAPQPYPPAQLRLHQPGYGSAALSYRDSSYVRGGGAVGSVGGVGAVGAGAAGAGEYRGGRVSLLGAADSSYVRGGGAVGSVGGVGAVGAGAAGAGEYRGGRVSLLGAAYLPPPPAPAAHHPPPADPPPFKKIRLTADRTPLSHHQPLRVDTREPVNQYSTVEVLSPNPPSEPTMEDQSFRTTKDDLLQQISKVDREMALSESTLSKLKKKQEELEQTASKPARAEEPEETVPRHRSLAQCVYAENRKKISMDNKRQMQASSAHAVLSHLGPPVLYPLYNQPQDTEVYHENIRRHRTFRKRLAEHIRKLKLEAEKREDALAEAYSRRAAEWLRRVERIEQGQKRKAKDARNREFFEKVFPELRKQREERERFHRLGARVKSEAELEEIADGLHEQEHEDKKMRSLTVVPPLLRDPSDATPKYVDTNRRCMDMESEHKELQLRNVWSQAERELFREKYLQHPKNFGQIASFLPRKSVRDCVRFYYLSKKAENYKQLLRKPRQRRSARNPPRAQPEPELPAGVTTRLQRSQGTTARGTENKEPNMDESMPQVTDPVTCIPIPTAAPAQPPR
uniref:SANT domain-containing protein n=1 Tax=Heliothis virescens TaxID=7102 RepID=A0A2A4K398_HELVI